MIVNFNYSSVKLVNSIYFYHVSYESLQRSCIVLEIKKNLEFFRSERSTLIRNNAARNDKHVKDSFEETDYQFRFHIFNCL